MDEDKNKFFLYFSLIMIGGLLVAMGFFGFKYFDHNPLFETEPASEEQIIEHCSGLNLEKTANCLRDQVSTFYKFNITPDSLTLSFDKIKERGGDCKDWSLLYQRLSYKLGFTSKTHEFKATTSFSHMFITIADEGGYCILDQIKLPVCYKLV